MFRNSLFDNPLALFLLFISVVFTNIILSVHFISILLAGVVFIAFIRVMEKKYYYSLILIILSFSIIETMQGLKLFSLLFLSLFIYIFIIPKLKVFLTSINFYTIILLFIFYSEVVILFAFLGDINGLFLSKIVINYFIDIFIVSGII
jgi:hypothetical protein